ncbi:MAG TPA: amidohydrolase [Bryobacteraceae bacterium]|nr:amidohydrolase [Bryobacteraceae bacterium]
MRKTSISFLLLCASAFAQKPADLIVSAGTVLTMDAGHRAISNGAVAISGGRILAVGPKAEIVKSFRAKSRIDRPGAILLPGLINAHTHASMSLLRGLADDVNLVTWLREFIFPAEAKNVDREFVRWGARLGMLEMLLGGTTTYTDMYYFEDDIAEVTKQAGMRGVLGQTVIGFPAPDYKAPEAALAATEQFILKWKNDPLITPAVAPHAVYTNSPETLHAAAQLADKYGVPFLIHVSETKPEDVPIYERHKKSAIRLLADNHAIARRSVFAHGVWISPEDRPLLVANKVGLVHCPSSNMKLGSGQLPLAEFMSLGVRLGLGPDGPAGSNNDFDMFEEMDLAAKLAKVNASDLNAVSARTVVEMATIGGARALQMEGEIGSLEVGKRADLITVSTLGAHATPAHDPYSMLVYSLKAGDVEDVVIEGRTVVRGRKPLTLNVPEILAKAHEIRARVDASIKK